jgi:hypothetical protein
MNLISADGQFLAEATSQHPDKELGRRKPPEQSVPFIFGKTPIGYVPHSESCVLDLVSAFGAIPLRGTSNVLPLALPISNISLTEIL